MSILHGPNFSFTPEECVFVVKLLEAEKARDLKAWHHTSESLLRDLKPLSERLTAARAKQREEIKL